MIDLISDSAKIGQQSLNTTQSEAVTVSPFFSPAVPSTTATHGYFVLSPVSLASRDQDGGPVGLNDRHLRSHGTIRDGEQSKRFFE